MADYDDLINALQPLVSRVRTDATARKGPNGSVWTREPLTEDALRHHVNGGPARGVSPIKPGENVTMVALLDLDSHKGESSWAEMTSAAIAVSEELERRGLRPSPFRSSGGKGIHLYMLWDEPQDARSVRIALRDALAACGYTNGTGGIRNKQIEIFPKQDSVPPGKFGNQFILPLAGASEPLSPFDMEPVGKELAPSVQWPASDPVEYVEPATKAASTITDVDTEQLNRALWAIPNDIADRDEWFRIMCAFKEGGGDKEVARAWTEQFTGPGDPKFDGPWDSITIGKDGGAPVDYLFQVAERHGWDELKVEEFPIEDVESEPEPDPVRFQVLSADQFANRPPPQWIIKGVLPKAELIVTYGASGSGKSFLALDMAMAIAQGLPWRGRRVRKGRVVYIAAEGAGGFRNRLQAYALANGIELASIDIGIIHAAPNFLERKDISDVIAAIKASGGADLVIVDTFAQVTPGANENAGEDMGKALGHCKRINAAIDAAVNLIHHAGKDASKGARGWSGLRAAADAEIEVVRAETGRMIRLTKAKDGEDNVEWGFDLKVVQIGVDEDLDPITSCVVIEAEVPVEPTKNKKMGQVEQVICSVVDEMAMFQSAVIEKEAVILESVKRMEKPTGEDSRRSRVKRALAKLLKDTEWPYSDDGDDTISAVRTV